MNSTQKIIISLGIILLIVGLTWPWLSKLPGDIVVDKQNFKFFFPITTMIILSLIISFIIWVIKKN